MSKRMIQTIKGLAIASVALALTACVDPSVFQQSSSTSQQTSLTNAGNLISLADQNLLNNINSNQYLNVSQLTSLLDKTDNRFVKNQILLKLTDKLIGENKLEAAQYYLSQFVKTDDSSQNNNYLFLASKVGNLLGDQRLLSNATDLDLTKLSSDQLAQALQLQLNNNFTAGNTDKALTLVNDSFNKLSVAEQKTTVDLVLGQLTKLSEEDLGELASQAAVAGNSINVGWYRLAQLAVANKNSVAKLNDVWSIWYNAFRVINHPAALVAPSMFKQTGQVSIDTAKNIYVLLPLTDASYQEYAQAIKAGFNQANLDSTINAKVNYLDTAKMSVNDALATAYQNNADLVVGPLTKEKVIEASDYNLERPQLMLNFNNTNPNLKACYVSQKIEYEADRGVELFGKLNIKTPVVIYSNSSSFTRAKDEFVKKWLETHQQNVKAYTYSSLSELTVLATNLSRQTPAVDGVAFFGDAQSLVKFKQLWNLNTAKEVNVFATSASNTLVLNRSKLADINGVYFTENNLVAEPTSELAQTATKVIDSTNYNLSRLYGFGYDAYYISQNLSSLQKVQGYSLTDKTWGSISKSYGNDCNLELNSNIYQIQNGTFTPVGQQSNRMINQPVNN